MPNIKTYAEIPYIGDDTFSEVDIVCIFGYLNIEEADQGSFIIARNFRDNCINCDCDMDLYNPAFLLVSNTFSESLEENATDLRGSVQIFKSIEEVELKIKDIESINLHQNNDLIIYQISADPLNVAFKAFKVHKAIPPEKAKCSKLFLL